MISSLTEFVTNAQNASIVVEAEKGIVRGAKILGLTSRNGREYPESTVRAAIGLYEGASVNINHPKGSASQARDYQDRFGIFRNVQFRLGEGLFGDLHYNPKHQLAEGFAWWAANEPRAVGFSHNVEGRTAKRDGKVVVEAITRVQSVDLVADPATTNGINESQQTTEPNEMDLKTITLEQLTAERPDLATKIVENYKNGEEAKNLAEQLKEAKAKLDALEAEKKLGIRKTLVEQKIAEAKLPAYVVTDVFRQQCLEAADDAAIAALIADRQAIVKGQPASFNTPTSKDQMRESAGGVSNRPLREVLKSGR